jgi:ketosteroid isomerase-like protein
MKINKHLRLPCQTLLFSAILLIWGVNIQATSQKSAVDDAEAVRQARLDQNYAMAAGDVERVASFWTDDITLRRGLGASIIGKDAYRALLDTAPNEMSLIYVREPDLIEISPHWPLAYESGTWTARRESTDGLAVITGRYSAQWVKREGYWLIRSEIFVALICSDDACIWSALP